MISYPPGKGPNSTEGTTTMRNYFEDIAAIRSRLGKPTTVQEEVARFVKEVRPGPSMMQRLQKLNLIDTVNPAQSQNMGVSQ